MSKITWPNRTDLKTAIGATYEWAAAIANAVKDSVNTLYTDKKTWYVSKGGDNSKTGSTRSEPYQTIAKAISVMASGDVIELLGVASSIIFNEDLTIPVGLTAVTIKGPIPNTEGGPRMTIDGTWTLDGDNISFNNLDVAVTWDRSTDFNLTCSNCKMSSPFEDRLAVLALNNCVWTVHATTNIESLILNNCTLVGNNTVNINTFFRSHHADIVGSISAGLIASSDIVLRNTSITGNLTIIGNLDQENSTVKGSTTVSETTTGVNQRPYETIKIPLGARDTAHTTGTNKVGLHIDYNFTFIGLPTLEFDPIITDGGPTGNAFVVDINVADIDGANEASTLSTKLSVDAGEFHSSTAATPCVLSSNTIAKYKFISIDIDTIGGTLAGKGGFVTLNGYRT